MGKHPFKMWLNVAEFLAKTQHLTPAELGAYVRLHLTMWLSTDGTLPNSPRVLMRIAKVRACHWIGLWKGIKSLFSARGKTITDESLQTNLIEAKTKIVMAEVSGRMGGQTTQFRRSSDPKLRGPWAGHKPLKNNDGGRANAQANTIQEIEKEKEGSGSLRPQTGEPLKGAFREEPVETPLHQSQSLALPEGPSPLDRALENWGEAFKRKQGGSR